MKSISEETSWLLTKINRIDEQSLWNHNYISKLWNQHEKIIKLCSLQLQKLVENGQITSAQKDKIWRDSKMDSEIIDISLFESKYFKLEDGDAADVVLKDWKTDEFDYKGNKSLGIYAKVIEENGKEVEKELNASSSLSKQLTPCLNDAVSNNKNRAKLRITRVGMGTNTRYTVRAI